MLVLLAPDDELCTTALILIPELELGAAAAADADAAIHDQKSAIICNKCPIHITYMWSLAYY